MGQAEKGEEEGGAEVEDTVPERVGPLKSPPSNTVPKDSDGIEVAGAPGTNAQEKLLVACMGFNCGCAVAPTVWVGAQV